MPSATPGTVTTRYAGRRIERVEDTRLLTGRGTFVEDITRPGMLHACFVRSRFAQATGHATAAAGRGGSQIRRRPGRPLDRRFP